ncbi:hypothetical protein LP114_056 [Listeria phage LP-114]|uniref:Uncharacterized protein n=1 Tax=Listeria phage LP-114 TaxID=1458857 RepID=A0A059T639_9CAUD|nr:hypothetical protein LP114_056 [Listeria phage LP-114]AHL18644.1 hypothetical protein LP114_056 [Listeria phage LP-114]
MKQTKKEMLMDSILSTCDGLARESISKKERETLHEFVERRLQLHGRSGYLFHTVQYYKRVYIRTDFGGCLDVIAEYVLKSNHLKIKGGR